LEWKDILGLLSWPEGFSDGPEGHASRSCFALSGTHAGPDAAGIAVSDDEVDEDEPDWDVLEGASAARAALAPSTTENATAHRVKTRFIVTSRTST
jgi:hypothetical protein